MHKYIITLIGIIALGTQVGCEALMSIQTSVNAIASSDTDYSLDYILLSGAPDVKENDLQFAEFSRYLNTVLARQGYTLVEDQSPSTTVIVFDYYIGEPEIRTKARRVSEYGQTGYSSSTTTGTARTRGTYSQGYNNGIDYSGRTRYESTTRVTPEYGITGYHTVYDEYTTYTREIHVSAYKAIGEDREAKELWRTSAYSTGTLPDLRRVMPYMLHAASPYLGKSTPNGEVRSSLRMNNTEVKELIATSSGVSP